MKQNFSVIALLALSLGLVPQPVRAQLATDPAFDASLLITDKAFADVGTFGTAQGIQDFLERHDSALADTSTNFLLKLKEPDSTIKKALDDPQSNLDRPRTAAELIYDASTQHGLNPQVMLVILEKEQSLITGDFSGSALQGRLDRALGFGCPDNGGCGDIFLGFYRQLFGTFDADGSRWLGAAASLMRSFNTESAGVRIGRGPMIDSQNQVFGSPKVRTSRVGDTIVIDNTLGGYRGVQQHQTVTLTNSATAALYRYTPHVFNGNYNFWRLYQKWFKYPNGTIISLLDDPTLYVIDNGAKRAFSEFVATQRKIDISIVVTVSENEFDEYPTEPMYTPLDGTLIVGDVNATVFEVQSNKIHPISGPIFTQRKYSFNNVVTLPQDEVDSYDQGGFLPPLDGTLVVGQASPAVYLIEGGLKRAITYEVFVARKYSFGSIMSLSDVEVDSIQSGPLLYPPDETAIMLEGTTGIYWFRNNQKRFVSAFVYEQRGVASFPHVILTQELFDIIPTGTAFSPRDGTVIQAEGTTGIYLIQGELKSLLTPASYARLRHPVPTILSPEEVNSYPDGPIIEQ